MLRNLENESNLSSNNQKAESPTIKKNYSIPNSISCSYVNILIQLATHCYTCAKSILPSHSCSPIYWLLPVVSDYQDWIFLHFPAATVVRYTAVATVDTVASRTLRRDIFRDSLRLPCLAPFPNPCIIDSSGRYKGACCHILVTCL